MTELRPPAGFGCPACPATESGTGSCTGYCERRPVPVPGVKVAEGPFAVIAYRVRRDGGPYPGGTWLRETATRAMVACETCGPLPAEVHGWTSDWISLCGAARDHVKETGHRAAVESWNGAVYGREDEPGD